MCLPLCFAVWEGSSVWDLPIDTTAQGPALEQLQQLEKAKAAKVRTGRYCVPFASVFCFQSSYDMALLIFHRQGATLLIVEQALLFYERS